ncbi:hypothetical protein GCM10010166_34780 [Couchioplanes caeruleus subsp. azureus]|nr:hypothetical protein GCM10010166_34780 [Couchioplanes caeruleus subsp. azureus]
MAAVARLSTAAGRAAKLQRPDRCGAAGGALGREAAGREELGRRSVGALEGRWLEKLGGRWAGAVGGPLGWRGWEAAGLTSPEAARREPPDGRQARRRPEG